MACRLPKDTKPVQRGLIRYVVLVLDLSERMLETDMRPTRFVTIWNYALEYVREFFEQNPLSVMSVVIMRGGVCETVSELSGNPADLAAGIRGLRYPVETAKEPKGAASLENALKISRAKLHGTPEHGSKEVIIVFGSMLTLDPGDIHATIDRCAADRVRVSIIGMNARIKVCQTIVERTNAGDDKEYVVATDRESLRQYLLATITPRAVRKKRKDPNDTTADDTPVSAGAALMLMGFPSRITEDSPTLCACHSALSSGGYICPRCKAKVCSLPMTCPCCRLSLALSQHLARSYHHLFPLRNWAEVSWDRAREVGSFKCFGCNCDFPDPPDVDADTTMQDADADATTATANNQGKDMEKRKEGGKGKGKEKATEEPEEQEETRASESARYECPVCHLHFCVDCDVYAHTELFNCAGCCSRPPKE